MAFRQLLRVPPLTIRIVMAELCRRVTGTTLQSLFDHRVRTAYGDDFFLGLPAEQ
ncbi:hypothetical protein [Arthrobacter sp. UYEF21]|uniref:hypothetical protein n=1 Tax=Arthrobacter sp. UYEF21 TaxID=1756364 RepID=UPI003396EEA9